VRVAARPVAIEWDNQSDHIFAWGGSSGPACTIAWRMDQVTWAYVHGRVAHGDGSRDHCLQLTGQRERLTSPAKAIRRLCVQVTWPRGALALTRAKWSSVRVFRSRGSMCTIAGALVRVGDPPRMVASTSVNGHLHMRISRLRGRNARLSMQSGSGGRSSRPSWQSEHDRRSRA
jgi:hypothetical protein